MMEYYKYTEEPIQQEKYENLLLKRTKERILSFCSSVIFNAGIIESKDKQGRGK